MSEESKQRLKEYQKNIIELKIGMKNFCLFFST